MAFASGVRMKHKVEAKEVKGRWARKRKNECHGPGSRMPATGAKQEDDGVRET